MSTTVRQAIANAAMTGVLAAGLAPAATASEFSSVISLADRDGFTLGLTLAGIGACALAILVAAVFDAVSRRQGRFQAPGQGD